jgi:hypothetical protein
VLVESELPLESKIEDIATLETAFSLADKKEIGF